MSVRVQTFVPQVTAYIENASNQGLNAAASYYVDRLRETVGTKFPPASTPGNPPHKRTGWGQKMIKYTRAIGTTQGARVGIDVSQAGPHGKTAFYMILLEIGTRLVARRPWLIATLHRYLKQIGEIAASGGKSGRAA